MKLLFVDVSRRAWGTEQHFASLATGCHRAGHGVTAIVRAESDVGPILERYGVDVRRVDCRGGLDPRLLLLVWRCITELGPQWIVTNRTKLYWPMYIIAMLRGCRIAAFKHIINIGRWHIRVLMPYLVDVFFVVSDFAADKALAAGVPIRNLRRLYNPIDLEKFKPCGETRASARERLGIPQDAFVVGFVGRHCNEKGVDVLREALGAVVERRDDVFSLWIGEGPDRVQTVEWLRHRTGLARHRIVDWTPSPERYLPAMDCLVAPSRIEETFGRVVVEAQACAIPVIAMASAGMVEAFQPGITGLPIHAPDPVAVENAIMSMASDPAMQAKMASNAVAFAAQFDMTEIAETFIKILEMS